MSTPRLTHETSEPLPVVITSAHSASTFTLRTGVCIVGSGPDANYVLDDKTVSRRHVSLQLVPEGLRVTDLGSTNGTSCRGQRVIDVVVASNSTLHLGRVSLDFRFQLEPDETKRPPCPELLVDEAPDLRWLHARLERLQGSQLPVRIDGETAASKRFLARIIHEHSRLRDGPFVTIQCGALNRDLVRAELFGDGSHEDSTTHPDAFAQAANGTLFLNEIDELPLDLQARLVRSMHERVMMPFGQRSTLPTVRLIASAARDLSELVEQGTFRDDLRSYTSVVALRVPPPTRPLEAASLANADQPARTGYARE